MALSVAVSSGVGPASTASPLALCHSATLWAAYGLVVLGPSRFVVADLVVARLARCQRVWLDIAILAEVRVQSVRGHLRVDGILPR